MLTGVVNTGSVVVVVEVVGGGSDATLVSGTVAGGAVVVALVVVALTISGGSSSASIGVTPSSAGRLQAPASNAKPHTTVKRRRVLRSLMRPPLAGGRRTVRRHPVGPRPMLRRPARW